MWKETWSCLELRMEAKTDWGEGEALTGDSNRVVKALAFHIANPGVIPRTSSSEHLQGEVSYMSRGGPDIKFFKKAGDDTQKNVDLIDLVKTA